MGEATRYPPGTFCWVDLGTPDVGGARAFYGDLLGWEFAEVPGGDDPYVLCRVRGLDVAGIHRHGEPDAPPPHWDSYVCVEDVDDAARRARDLGAEVALEPFEVPGTARMAALRDPTGAAVTLWEPVGFPGARLVNELGTWTWNDLSTGDPETAGRFYGELFGWRVQQVAPTYWSISMGDLLVGGMHAIEGGGQPPAWFPYFVVAEADPAASRVEELGGTVVVPPRDVPAGRFTVILDPGGAVCALFEMGPQGAFRGVDQL